VRVRIGKWSKTIIVFLTSRIPKSQFHMFSIDFNIGNIVFEDGWNIDLSSSDQLVRYTNSTRATFVKRGCRTAARGVRHSWEI
jgi:hypothetical protein